MVARVFTRFQQSYRTLPLALLLAGCGQLAAADDTALQEQLAQMRNEIRVLRAEVVHLRSRLKAAEQSKPSKPGLVTIDPFRTTGNPKARVGIVEFSDYQCPYCRRFHRQTFDAIKRKYIDSGKILYSYRDFPLNLRPENSSVAIAANCAGKQGAFWAMQRRLFQDQQHLGQKYYARLATEMQLDGNAFETCLDDARQTVNLEDDLAYGQGLGVRGTPHFFVGSIKGGQLVDAVEISGAQSFTVFAQAIEGLLEPR